MNATQIWTKMNELSAIFNAGGTYDQAEFTATMNAWAALSRTEQANVMATAKARRGCNGCGADLNRRGECDECGYMG